MGCSSLELRVASGCLGGIGGVVGDGGVGGSGASMDPSFRVTRWPLSVLSMSETVSRSFAFYVRLRWVAAWVSSTAFRRFDSSAIHSWGRRSLWAAVLRAYYSDARSSRSACLCNRSCSCCALCTARCSSSSATCVFLASITVLIVCIRFGRSARRYSSLENVLHSSFDALQLKRCRFPGRYLGNQV